MKLSRYSNLLLVAMLATTVAFTGCAKKKKAADVGHFPDGQMLDANGNKIESYANGDKSGAPGAEPGWNDAANGKKMDGSNAENSSGEKSMEGSAIGDLPNVMFALDSADLNDAASTQTEKNAAYLEKHPELMVVLRGHTDDSGTEEYNFSLGSRRAQVVRDYLISKGVPADRLETMSLGEAMPLASGEDEATRSKNRRVEFFVYQK
ncbi:hypothetical protein BH09SUM1_BH09SUM1_20430 [soil metagenome]